jgi:hypothetical protein
VRSRAPARLDVLFGRHGDAWRLYVRGWAPPYLRVKLDQHGEAWPVRAPDLEALREYMWKLDAPYVAQSTAEGGVALAAVGRSAVMLWEWLDDCLAGAA